VHCFFPVPRNLQTHTFSNRIFAKALEQQLRAANMASIESNGEKQVLPDTSGISVRNVGISNLSDSVVEEESEEVPESDYYSGWKLHALTIAQVLLSNKPQRFEYH
jgi:hypothetical protein